MTGLSVDVIDRAIRAGDLRAVWLAVTSRDEVLVAHVLATGARCRFTPDGRPCDLAVCHSCGGTCAAR